MADELTIKIDGTEYPFPSFDTLTYKEARFIKKETGLVMGQFFQALEDGDPDALMAVALIARKRDNKPFDPDELDSLLLTAIEIVVPEEKGEEAADPASPLDSTKPGSASENSGEPASDVVELFGS